MENKILETIKLKQESKVKIEINEDTLKLEFEKDIIILDYEHEQDCCENVYADFSVIKNYIPQIDKKYKEVIIKGVDDIGILICFIQDYGRDEKIFIPCYNEQNGYYSDDLTLIIKHNNIIKKIDITDFKEDNID